MTMDYENIEIDEQTRLVQLQPDQAGRLFELTDKNRAYLGEFLPWPHLVKVIDDSRTHIEETLEKRAQNIAYTYGIEQDGEIVGDISIRNLNGTEKLPEIGYWISPDYAGKGITTKAVQAITNLGLSTLGLDTIIIRASPLNGASNKVAEKAGYVQVGSETKDGERLNIWSSKG
jgi:ribosomal-protein-serine acetyltransferase